MRSHKDLGQTYKNIEIAAITAARSRGLSYEVIWIPWVKEQEVWCDGEERTLAWRRRGGGRKKKEESANEEGERRLRRRGRGQTGCRRGKHTPTWCIPLYPGCPSRNADSTFSSILVLSPGPSIVFSLMETRAPIRQGPRHCLIWKFEFRCNRALCTRFWQLDDTCTTR